MFSNLKSTFPSVFTTTLIPLSSGTTTSPTSSATEHNTPSLNDITEFIILGLVLFLLILLFALVGYIIFRLWPKRENDHKHNKHEDKNQFRAEFASLTTNSSIDMDNHLDKDSTYGMHYECHDKVLATLPEKNTPLMPVNSDSDSISQQNKSDVELGLDDIRVSNV